MGKRGAINALSDGLDNFWSIFWLHRPIFLTLVLNYTIITLHRADSLGLRLRPR